MSRSILQQPFPDTSGDGVIDEIEYSTLSCACKRLLQKHSFSTQHDVRVKLVELGFKGISQSTVSRLLAQLGVVKVPNASGQRMYCITSETAPIHISSSIASQIEFITHNQSTVVVKTHPGSAQLIARLIDVAPHADILGTVAGNDTVIIIPRDINQIEACEQIVRAHLGMH